MSPAAIEHASPESSSADENRPLFADLRGMKWRIDLGILPPPPSSLSSFSTFIDDLRRVTADSRRRYAGLRRCLLINPHMHKKAISSPDLVIDNPLSQNPDSTWGRFFRNAELEKMVDQDLSRLYPEHGSYFQKPGCQGMLRRILLLWCLRHPEYGYRQGMHELLAPLLYVLHVDVVRLSEVREKYEDHFTDKFDGLSFDENDTTYNCDFKRFLDAIGDEIGSHANGADFRSLVELDPEIKTIVLLSDAYGAEGELGIVLSEKFMEHDAYCMFDALMSGSHGSVAMADFFSASPPSGSHTGLPPVIEASAAFYHLLSLVDRSLHSHLVELGVEPQYFALRWLRVLFGREFSLEHLLLIWDEIFAADNKKLDKAAQDDAVFSFNIFSSPRGALISAMAVAMILHLRSSLLATENATTCLQRLLNFPGNIDLRRLIDKANSLEKLALEASATSSSFFGAYNYGKSIAGRNHTVPSDCVSPKTPLNMVPESYWEEKWRVLHKAEELKHRSLEKQHTSLRKGWSDKVRKRLSRAASDPCPSNGGIITDHKSPVRRNLLEDLSRELAFDEDIESVDSHKGSDQKDYFCAIEERRDGSHRDSTSTDLGGSSSGSVGCGSPISSNEHESDLENGCVALNLPIDGNEDHPDVQEDPACLVSDHTDIVQEGSALPVSDCTDNVREGSALPVLDHTDSIQEDSALPVSDHTDSIREGSSLPVSDHTDIVQEVSALPVPHPPTDSSVDSGSNNKPTGNSVADHNERKLLSKFQWFWKLGRTAAGEERSEKRNKGTEAANTGNGNQIISVGHPCADECGNSCASGKDVPDQNVMGTFRNLGQSMLEHIQVLESVFQQDRGQVGSLENFSKNVIVGKGQATAMTALKELRKISNLLSEM